MGATTISLSVPSHFGRSAQTKDSSPGKKKFAVSSAWMARTVWKVHKRVSRTSSLAVIIITNTRLLP